MRPEIRCCLSLILGLTCAVLLLSPAPARCDTEAVPPSRAASNTGDVDDSTWVDHDQQPIEKPPDWEPSFWGRQFHQSLVEPLSHTFDIPDKLLKVADAFGADSEREAVNVNAFDEAPNSTWFTNRNHRRAVSVAELRLGPDSVMVPTKPWTIKHAKQGGWTAGFQIKDADGGKWLVKLDPVGYPQLSSGADMVARTLLHAAGYNVPNNQPVRFRQDDVVIDADLLSGAEGELFTQADLESVLVKGALFPDGSHSAFASLFLPDHVLGSPSMNQLRPGDSNDWYAHTNRRELRGLFVLCSWLGNWDTKDHQFLDTFVQAADSLGHVKHYILDVGSSLGAAATGPKQLWASYENMVDLGWMARRLMTLGFVEEPWRRANQESGIPSVGNYESEEYRPEDFKQLLQQPAFREMTDRDGYWGAKIVASFSDDQIAAAVEAGQYEDPRARDYLVKHLIVRRDKIARHWFGRVAPLDFFWVDDGALRFHDLAVDIGLEESRVYDVKVESKGKHDEQLKLNNAQLPLLSFGEGASHLSLEISVVGNRAKPAFVELTRIDSVWTVTRVRHG